MAPKVVVELAPWLGTSELRELMLLLIGWRGVPERDQIAVDEALEQYSHQANLFPYGVVHDGKLAGMIGIEASNNQGIIRHIVVALPWRRCGIGRLLIDEATTFLRLSRLEAETDIDAIWFYSDCGFKICSLGEKYPGRERFLCTLEI